MKRVIELETVLRDSILVSLTLEYEYYSKTVKQENFAKLKFIRFETEIIELELFDILESDICSDFSGLCISHIKAFNQNGGVRLSLDPYDERVNDIEEKDNFVFTASRYQLNVSHV